ncbi:ATP-binding protein [bacterium]|nr:ATP-binding protein [bacterium]
MGADLNTLYNIYNIYYEKALEFQRLGRNDLAKRNYYEAASALLKMAEINTPELKKAQIARAKQLLTLADSLVSKNHSSTAIKGNNNDTSRDAASNDEEPDKIWKCAEIPDIKFSDVAGLDEVKKEIVLRMINPVKFPEKYKVYKKKTGGGILLYGPPGTGKTMIAKAIANEVGAKFYAIKGSDIVSKWVGESEKNINSLFETARKDPLAIIFIDEVDSLLRNRGDDPHNYRRVNEFLQQMDGFIGRNPNLLLLGATNRPWDIDNAAVRSGRFSQKIYVPLPDAKAREFIIKKNIEGIPLDKDVSVGFLVDVTEGLCGADIEEICDMAKSEPLSQYISTDEIVKIKLENFIKVLKHFKPTVSKAEIKEFEKYAGINASRDAIAMPFLKANAAQSESAAPEVLSTRENLEISEVGAEIENSEGELPIQDAEQKAEIQKPDNQINSENSKKSISENEKQDVAAVSDENKDIEILGNDTELILQTKTLCLIPGEEIYIKFYLSKQYDSVYFTLDTHNYMCVPDIKNWSGGPIINIEPGNYKVRVFSGGEIARFDIKVIKGMEEQDLGI